MPHSNCRRYYFFFYKSKNVCQKSIEIKCCSVAKMALSPGLRNHICKVQSPTNVTSSWFQQSFSVKIKNGDAKMIILTYCKSHRSRNICQNYRSMIFSYHILQPRWVWTSIFPPPSVMKKSWINTVKVSEMTKSSKTT